jgi:hypothetical protein|tara:strand:- start:8490 stop:8759 length:270 start_codon:yes stop_codon:yes gene_type:complete
MTTIEQARLEPIPNLGDLIWELAREKSNASSNLREILNIHGEEMDEGTEFAVWAALGRDIINHIRRLEPKEVQTGGFEPIEETQPRSQW